MAAGDSPQIKDLITTLQLTSQNLNANIALLTAAIKNPTWVNVPATATSPGIAGQVAYQSGFFYVCVANNVWQRVALVTF